VPADAGGGLTVGNVGELVTVGTGAVVLAGGLVIADGDGDGDREGDKCVLGVT
jgi:hypothetical protein